MTGTSEVMDFLFDGMQTPAKLYYPQAKYPSGHEAGGYSWFPQGMAFYDLADEEQALLIRQEAAKLANVIRELQATGKVIITGMSQGGDLALHLAVYHPDVIDLAIPCAGRLSAVMRPDDVSDSSVVIRMQQGEVDAIVSVESAREARNWLKGKGFDVDLDTYPDVGHDFSAEMIARIQGLVAS
jgi:phospholipase/carboxylesterase